MPRTKEPDSVSSCEIDFCDARRPISAGSASCRKTYQFWDAPIREAGHRCPALGMSTSQQPGSVGTLGCASCLHQQGEDYQDRKVSGRIFSPHPIRGVVGIRPYHNVRKNELPRKAPSVVFLRDSNRSTDETNRAKTSLRV